MKASNYVIYTHIPETDEYYLVHGYSGAVDKVSPEVVRYLLDRVDPAHTWHIKDQEIVGETLRGREIGEASPDSVEMLKKRGYLTNMSSGEERSYVSRLAGFLHTKKVSHVAPTFMLVPSYECNLRCPYCFEADTRVQLNKLKVLQNVMTEREVDAAFTCMDMLVADRFAGQETSPTTKQGITLYGGEPLMLETLPIVEYMVQKGLDRGYSFSAITNAVDLHNYLHLLGPDKIQFLQVTLDGPKEFHDRKRIGPRHKDGTFERILRNMKLALERGTRVSVRFHVDFNNVATTKVLTDELEREGFNQYKGFGIYTYPIHMFHQGFDSPVFPQMAIHHMHREIIKLSHSSARAIEQATPVPVAKAEQKPKALKIFLPDDGIESKLRVYIKNKLAGLFNSNMEPCAATTGLYIFDAFGKIYSCWDSVGIAGHETGTYSSDGPVLNSYNLDWLSRSPATINECKDCKYAMFHFGGCASLPIGCKGTIFAPACYDFQDNFLYVAQRLFRDGLPAATQKQATGAPVIHEATTGAEAGLMG